MTEAVAYDEDEARNLIRRIGAGCQRSFETLYRMMSRRVFAYVQRALEDPGAAEEVMMDTLYEVWMNAGRFRFDSRVSTWVLGIARNKMLMAMRSNRDRGHADIEDYEEILDAEVPDGFVQLEKKQTREILHQCLRQLSWAHRECLHLLHFEDWSIAEIAQLTEVPEGTVKSRLSHARSRLAKSLQAATAGTPLEC